MRPFNSEKENDVHASPPLLVYLHAMAAAADPKRSRSDESSSAANAAAVPRSELEDLLAHTESSIAADATSLIQNMERSITEEFSSLIRAVDSANQKRFGGIEADLHQLRQRMDASESSNKEFRDQLGLVSKALVVAENPAPTRRDLVADDWDREPDHNVLRVNFIIGQHVTKISVEQAIRPWLEETNLKNRTMGAHRARIDIEPTIPYQIYRHRRIWEPNGSGRHSPTLRTTEACTGK